MSDQQISSTTTEQMSATTTGVPWAVATTLAGGEWFSGITLALTAQMFWRYGVSFEIINDRKRQILLNLICFLCAINTTISYGFNATRESVLTSDVTTLITFASVQYGLVILNHNTLVRAANLVQMSSLTRETADKISRFLYLLPLLTLIPVYLSMADVIGTDNAINTSPYNLRVYKPMNIVLSTATEVFATITDVLLLMKVRSINGGLVEATSANTSVASEGSRRSTASSIGSRAKTLASGDLWVTYVIVWSLIVVDAAVKCLIAAGAPILFDSIITITTVAMRSRANLQYGLELQKIMNKGRRAREIKPAGRLDRV